MERFVRVEVTCGKTVLGQFSGELRSSRPLLVDAVHLVDLDDGRTVAAISAYPHRTEPTHVLLQRLLERVRLGDPLKAGFSASSKLAVTLSPDPHALFATTLAHITWSNASLACRLVYRGAVRESSARPPSGGHITVAGAVVMALNSAMGRVTIPPVPIALCAVPTRHHPGELAYVLLQDVPEYARGGLCKRMGLSPTDERVDAATWRLYLRALRHDRQCEILLAHFGPTVFKHSVSF